MSAELALIEALRAIATTAGSRGLADDAAVLEIGGERLVLTLDTMVESVHYLPSDPAETVAWKLVAVNASDISAKGADPLGCLYSHALGDDDWDRAFLDGLGRACNHFRMPLLGGDTVRMPNGAQRSFSLTALGTARAGVPVPSRSGAMPGDDIWVSGAIGDAGLGLAILSGRASDAQAAECLVSRYRQPCPETRLGPALAPYVTAMMDISDGLLIDAQRMANASGVSMNVGMDKVPLSAAFLAVAGGDLDSRLGAITAGDDYCLLFTAPRRTAARLHEAASALSCEVTAIGTVFKGAGISLLHLGEAVPLPSRLGYQH